MSKSLTAHEHPLRKVFCSDYNFSIPDYQRPYRWETDQALQLLDDLEETLDRDDDEPYFLGSLVLVQRADLDFDVIDGQQRLTTLSLLFAILRDLTSGKFADNIDALVRDPGSELDGIAPKPRLMLRPQDAAFFEKYAQTPGGIAELTGLSDNAAKAGPQRTIRNNARALFNRLSTWEDSKRRALATLASTRTYLVVVSTPDLHSAYRIFSVMNARGLDLTPSDIFKSKVVSAVPADSGYARRWEDAEESLGAVSSSAFTDLFGDIRTVVTGTRARRELLREFPEQVLDAYLNANRAAEFVDDLLLPYAKAFERTFAFDFGPGSEWQPVNAWLQRLAQIDNKDWRPAALWAITQHPDDAVYLAHFLRRLERLAATFLLRGAYPTPRITRYMDLLKDLKAGAELDAPTFQLSDEEKAEARDKINGRVYDMQIRRARYVLLRLDELLKNDPGATYSHSIISIEHVLPQHPRADSQWVLDFTEDERTYWTHRLGNLLLLNHRKNSQARNFDFTTKKKQYFTTSTGSAVFALTTQVLGHEEWTPAVVEQRQSELTQRLYDEWDLN